MQDLNYWKNIIKEKRRQTSFRDFLMEVASWAPFTVGKNNGIISRFPESDRIKICGIKEFDKNRDSLTNSWIDYDFNQDFFSNFKSLFSSVTLPGVFHYWENENCDYADVVLFCKNAYLSSIMIWNCENILYSLITRDKTINIYNSLFSVNASENVYFSVGTLSWFNIYYSRYTNNCNNIWFSSNLTWCSECIFSSDLENCSYYIHNKKYEKEEYFRKKEIILRKKEKFLEYYKSVDKIWKNHGSINVKWWFIQQSEDIDNGYFVYYSKNARNVFFIGTESWNENFFDVCPGWAWMSRSSDFYGVCWAWNGSDNLYCSSQTWSCSNVFYSYYTEWSSYCLGCIWLKNKSYCILNKQYKKEEWLVLANRIFEQMNNQNILWNFFPWELNPFNFNDTLAWILWDFKKQEIVSKWYMWRDAEIKTDIPKWSDVIEIKDLNTYQWYTKNWEWRINPEILNKVIVDNNRNYYRIVQLEYDFLVKHALPIPEIHWMDRMKLNFWVKI